MHTPWPRLARTQYEEIFISVGRTYRIALEAAVSLHTHPHVTYAHGGIGEQMAELKHWLADHADTEQVPLVGGAPR